MPRSQESQEGRILRYFRTAPLAAVTMLLALVKDTVRERAATRASIPMPSAVRKAPKVAKAPKPSVARSHHAVAPKKRVRVRPSRAKAARARVSDVPETELKDYAPTV